MAARYRSNWNSDDDSLYEHPIYEKYPNGYHIYKHEGRSNYIKHSIIGEISHTLMNDTLLDINEVPYIIYKKMLIKF